MPITCFQEGAVLGFLFTLGVKKTTIELYMAAVFTVTMSKKRSFSLFSCHGLSPCTSATLCHWVLAGSQTCSLLELSRVWPARLRSPWPCLLEGCQWRRPAQTFADGDAKQSFIRLLLSTFLDSRIGWILNLYSYLWRAHVYRREDRQVNII